ncbi:g5703 [Coccomyxa elongata]
MWKEFVLCGNGSVSALFGRKPSQASEGKPCKKCKSKGSLTCPGCKGTGKNKKNGNVFERWKCYDCQGFGLISCPDCGGKGLTPEQRGER